MVVVLHCLCDLCETFLASVISQVTTEKDQVKKIKKYCNETAILELLYTSGKEPLRNVTEQLFYKCRARALRNRYDRDEHSYVGRLYHE